MLKEIIIEGVCEHYLGGRCSKVSRNHNGQDPLPDYATLLWKNGTPRLVCQARLLDQGGRVNHQVVSAQRQCSGYKEGEPISFHKN